MELDHHRGGAGEPLVLVHGIGHTWRGFEPMLPLLEPSFDVLALDMPGFGRSAPLPESVEPTTGPWPTRWRRRWTMPASRPPTWPATRSAAGSLWSWPGVGAHGFDRTLSHTMNRQVRGLTTVRCPVLVLWGRRDVILLPRQGRRFEQLIPDAELRYLKGLGHVPISDDPELLAAEIEGFARQWRERHAAGPA